ncbi:MAG TPA: metal ABC transporter ATP-binding protein [Candidatus Deferrimicrobiaceae bacterium]|nr:metal ABC transporter ATP-binding protein [Candidatus Deferrimicrobiaceae bacterium]
MSSSVGTLAALAPTVGAVHLTDVSTGYDGTPAVEAASLDIPAGALVAVFGPNGGGKTTLLKLMAGLLEPWSGGVEILGGPPTAAARRIAYVPQAELVDWSFPVSVWDVAMMGRFPRLGLLRQPAAVDRQAVGAALERVGMLDHARTQIGRLSGGQRRRAFLARAIAADAELYLLDEPVTGVDVPTQEDLMTLLDEESKAGRTVIATTHDLAAASRHFSTVVGINRRIMAAGPVELLNDPDVLRRTYGGHLLMIGERGVLLDDAHHHDTASGPERHFHEGDVAP